jgi:hypothetical protein
VGVTLAGTLVFIVFAVLYSLVFVAQPIGAQSPNDAEFFKLIGPIATFIVGALSGLMASGSSKKEEPAALTEEPTTAGPQEPLLLEEEDEEENGPF